LLASGFCVGDRIERSQVRLRVGTIGFTDRARMGCVIVRNAPPSPATCAASKEPP
jgi:hypothetical protein